MTDKPTKNPDTESPLEQNVDESRRKLIKMALGGAAVYSLPLMTSFSMEGLNLGGDAFADSFGSNMCIGGNMTMGGNQTCDFDPTPKNVPVLSVWSLGLLSLMLGFVGRIKGRFSR